ncbi:hypothetical protein Tsubulata_045902 [Turnera subulata]|uniref:MATH domain-containing protein n=1 Tax=Turnera subulata TaxID=218843 RepID=A0A9Q0J7A8_9ROSI|nr:hypothetical protein Tsubulata_045902 [Turnera subulata]
MEADEEDPHIWGPNRFRKVPPADYLLKIESFSSLLESGMERFDTQYFESVGKKWKLSVHPGKKADIGGHISRSLAIKQPTGNTSSWGVNVNVKFFVLDQIRGQYLMIPGANGQERRFDWMKPEWRLPYVVSHDTFYDPSKGYLVNDCCVFGVEVLGNTRRDETLSWVVKQPGSFLRTWKGGGLFSWKIYNFSTINEDHLCSPVFKVGGHQWYRKRIRISFNIYYMHGKVNIFDVNGLVEEHMAIYLDVEIPAGKKIRDGSRRVIVNGVLTISYELVSLRMQPKDI